MTHSRGAGSGLRRRVTHLSAAALLALALILGVSMQASVAHASGTPTIVQSWTEHDFGNGDGGELVFQEAFTSLTDLTSGDEVVLLIGWGGGNDYQVSGVTNNGTASFASAFAPATSSPSQVTDGLQDGAAIWAAQVSSGGTVNLTLDFAEQGCPCGSTYILSTATLVEISGQATSGLSSGQQFLSESGSGGTTHTTNGGGSLGASNSDLDLAIYIDGGSNTTVSVASGESSLGGNDSPTVNMQFAEGSGSAQSSYTFDTSGSAAYAVVAAASFASA